MGTSINNTGGSFVIEIGGYGGEVVLGTITETQYKYWKFESEEELDQHISDIQVKKGKTRLIYKVRNESEEEWGEFLV